MLVGVAEALGLCIQRIHEAVPERPVANAESTLVSWYRPGDRHSEADCEFFVNEVSRFMGGAVAAVIGRDKEVLAGFHQEFRECSVVNKERLVRCMLDFMDYELSIMPNIAIMSIGIVKELSPHSMLCSRMLVADFLEEAIKGSDGQSDEQSPDPKRLSDYRCSDYPGTARTFIRMVDEKIAGLQGTDIDYEKLFAKSSLSASGLVSLAVIRASWDGSRLYQEFQKMLAAFNTSCKSADAYGKCVLLITIKMLNLLNLDRNERIETASKLIEYVVANGVQDTKIIFTRNEFSTGFIFGEALLRYGSRDGFKQCDYDSLISFLIKYGASYRSLADKVGELVLELRRDTLAELPQCLDFVDFCSTYWAKYMHVLDAKTNFLFVQLVTYKKKGYLLEKLLKNLFDTCRSSDEQIRDMLRCCQSVKTLIRIIKYFSIDRLKRFEMYISKCNATKRQENPEILRAGANADEKILHCVKERLKISGIIAVKRMPNGYQS
ncbi:hypothetical protein PAPHI01_2212 [Pancytospora philotis]|nr:hypothetical protein PAPHI01_2212 [Pancytospora philotis]